MWPSSCCSISGRNDLDAVDRSPQVDAEHPLPVVDRRLGDRGEEADAGVVAQDVDGAERVERRLRPVPRRRPAGTRRSRTPITSWPSARSSATASSRASWRTSATTTRMPAPANARTMPSPMPAAAPVTTATRPSTDCMSPPQRTGTQTTNGSRPEIMKLGSSALVSASSADVADARITCRSSNHVWAMPYGSSLSPVVWFWM